MSLELNKAAARGLQAHQIIANNQVGWAFTVSTAASATATTPCLPLLGDVGAAGRSNASSLAATISTATNTPAVWSLRLNNGVYSNLGTPVIYDVFVALSGAAAANLIISPSVLTMGQSRLDFRLYTMTNTGGAALSPMNTETALVTVVARGMAINTGLPV